MGGGVYLERAEPDFHLLLVGQILDLLFQNALCFKSQTFGGGELEAFVHTPSSDDHDGGHGVSALALANLLHRFGWKGEKEGGE